jgi:small subunit ribosomal protein S3
LNPARVNELEKERMGQKTHPVGYRLGYNRSWSSRWYAGKDFAKLLHEDIKIRKMVKEKLYHAGVSKIEIERSGDQTRVIIHTARPGIIIGRKGAEVDKLKAQLEKEYKRQVYITVKEIKKPELDSQLVSENIAVQLEKRVAFRRAMKRSIAAALRLGAQGIRITVAGRLGGAEIARTEWYREGRVPLHTLRADIDFGFAEAHTTMGQIGVKTWMYRGELLPPRPEKTDSGFDRR